MKYLVVVHVLQAGGRLNHVADRAVNFRRADAMQNLSQIDAVDVFEH